MPSFMITFINRSAAVHVNPGVPLPVERVLLKTLAKNPSDRYATAVDMVAAFRQAVEEAGMTELSTAQYRPPAAPVSSSAVTDQTIFHLRRPTRCASAMMQPTGSSSARRIAQRRRRNLWILGGIGALLLICLASLFIIVSAVSILTSGPGTAMQPVRMCHLSNQPNSI